MLCGFLKAKIEIQGCEKNHYFAHYDVHILITFAY